MSPCPPERLSAARPFDGVVHASSTARPRRRTGAVGKGWSTPPDAVSSVARSEDAHAASRFKGLEPAPPRVVGRRLPGRPRGLLRPLPPPGPAPPSRIVSALKNRSAVSRPDSQSPPSRRPRTRSACSAGRGPRTSRAANRPPAPARPTEAAAACSGGPAPADGPSDATVRPPPSTPQRLAATPTDRAPRPASPPPASARSPRSAPAPPTAPLCEPLPSALFGTLPRKALLDQGLAATRLVPRPMAIQERHPALDVAGLLQPAQAASRAIGRAPRARRFPLRKRRRRAARCRGCDGRSHPCMNHSSFLHLVHILV